MTQGCNICYVVTIFDCNHVKFHDVDIFDIYKYYKYTNNICDIIMCTHSVICNMKLESVGQTNCEHGTYFPVSRWPNLARQEKIHIKKEEKVKKNNTNNFKVNNNRTW